MILLLRLVKQRIPNQIDKTEHSASASKRVENLQFEDNVGLQSFTVPHNRDATFNVGMETNVGLATFLERPIYYKDIQWTATFTDHGDSVFTTFFDPFKEWQNNAQIKDKIKNYTYISFDLNVRFMYNGSPFQYGKMMINYVPYGEDYSDIQPTKPNEHKPYVYRNSCAAAAYEAYYLTATSGSPEIYFRYFSTYPTTYLDPAGNEVVEMNLPFLWHKNAFVVGAGESCGTIQMADLVPLWVANTNAPQELTISVFLQATNIKLGVPTQLVPFAPIRMRRKKQHFIPPEAEHQDMEEEEDDEYDHGPVSGVASAVAQAAGHLEKVPVIGGFARATKVGASMVGGIAKIFGFSTPQDGLPKPMYLTSAGRMAETIGEDNSHVLALDPKQELSVDPKQLFSTEDEMAFKSIITREQFISKSWWQKDHGFFTAPNTRTLFCGLVNPSLLSRTGDYTVAPNTYRLTMDTPGGRISKMFAYWRGSIIFRVEVVCTAMHKGRLLLSFDPNYTAAPAEAQIPTSSINTRYSTIMDIAKGKSQEFKIEYNSFYPYLRQKRSIEHSTFKPTRNTQTTMDTLTAYDPKSDMGIFTVEILTDLTAPISTNGMDNSHAPAQVLIWMRCGDDMEFAQPHEEDTDPKTAVSDPGWGSYFYLPYATIFEDTEEDEVEEMDVNPQTLDPAANNFFGEAVVSLRSLVKRYTLVQVGDIGTNNPGGITSLFAWRNVPMYSPLPITGFVRRHSFQSYISPMYLMMRGSSRWKLFNISPQTNAQNGWAGAMYAFFQRESYYGPTPPDTIQGLLGSTATTEQIATFMPHGYNGVAIESVVTQPFLTAQLPFYSNTRFALAVNTLNVSGSAHEALVQNYTMDQVLYGSYKAYTTGSNVGAGNQLYEYYSVGDDFTLSFFLAPPIVYCWTA